MTKKILIISGSPRAHGNSDILCDEFKRGALEAGNEVEKIRLSDKKINYCWGCGICNATGKCVQKDDMAELLQKMVNADVIVLATPVYFYAMNGQMKTFIDRTVTQYTKISNKDFYFIITAADTMQKHIEKVIEGFRGFTADCLDNAHEKGIVYGLGAWQKGEIENNQNAMKQAYEFGKNA
ncbi:MAG: flavodoxin family protein [Alphaproteobacteria bacterium]|nr:flavodoxin family protein [Alphaproteobacteria bacterium]